MIVLPLPPKTPPTIARSSMPLSPTAPSSSTPLSSPSLSSLLPSPSSTLSSASSRPPLPRTTAGVVFKVFLRHPNSPEVGLSQRVLVVGNSVQLGNWCLDNGLSLKLWWRNRGKTDDPGRNESNGDFWVSEAVYFNSSALSSLEFKCVVVKPSVGVEWEHLGSNVFSNRRLEVTVGEEGGEEKPRMEAVYTVRVTFGVPGISVDKVLVPDFGSLSPRLCSESPSPPPLRCMPSCVDLITNRRKLQTSAFPPPPPFVPHDNTCSVPHLGEKASESQEKVRDDDSAAEGTVLCSTTTCCSQVDSEFEGSEAGEGFNQKRQREWTYGRVEEDSSFSFGAVGFSLLVFLFVGFAVTSGV